MKTYSHSHLNSLSSIKKMCGTSAPKWTNIKKRNTQGRKQINKQKKTTATDTVP